MRCGVMFCFALFYYAMLCDVMLHVNIMNTLSCFNLMTIFEYVIILWFTICHAAMCYVMLCYGVLGCIVLL